MQAFTEATPTGQWAMAAVLGCIDSRVSLDVVFDLRIGDIIGARVDAGSRRIVRAMYDVVSGDLELP